MKFVNLGFLGFLLACQGPATDHTRSAMNGAVSPANTMAATTAPDTTVLEGKWYLMPLLPSDTAAGKTPVLELDLKKSHFSGNTGCNSMNGQFWFSSHDSSLSFSDKFVTTKMACPGYNERSFIKSLLNTAYYHLRNGVLILTSDENAELSRWIRKPSAPPKALKA
jgi:heat shock protein HslJ